MITKMTPADMDIAKQLMAHMSKPDVADKFDIDERTLDKYLLDYIVDGIGAFSKKAIIDWKRLELIGKDIHQCSEIIKEAGVDISECDLRRRMQELGIKYRPLQCDKIKHKYKGVEGLKEIARKHNISYSTLQYRCRELGFDIKDAVEMPPTPRFKYVWHGIKGAKYIAEHVGIPEATLVKRLQKGQDIYSAVNDLLAKKKRKKDARKIKLATTSI